MTPKRVLVKMNSMTNFVLRNRSKKDKTGDDIESASISPPPEKNRRNIDPPLQSIFAQEGRAETEGRPTATPRQLQEQERRRRLQMATQHWPRKGHQPGPSTISSTDEDPRTPRRSMNVDSAYTFPNTRMSQAHQTRAQFQPSQFPLDPATSYAMMPQSPNQQHVEEVMRIVKGDSYPATSSGRTKDDDPLDDTQTNESFGGQSSHLFGERHSHSHLRQENPHKFSTDLYNQRPPYLMTIQEDRPSFEEQENRAPEQSQHTPVIRGTENLAQRVGKEEIDTAAKSTVAHELSLSSAATHSNFPRITTNTSSFFDHNVLNLANLTSGPTNHEFIDPSKNYNGHSSVDNVFSTDLSSLEKLNGLNFTSLEQELFEKPSAIDAGLFSPEVAEGSLEEKIEWVRTLEESKQRSFMASLSADEWDEAGDWFVEQFARLTGQLQQCRRERKEIARKFEAVLSQRYGSILREEKDLIEAVENMRTTGGILVEQGSQKSKSKHAA